MVKWHPDIKECPEVGGFGVQASINGLKARLQRRAVDRTPVDEENELRPLAWRVLVGDEALNRKTGLLPGSLWQVCVLFSPAQAVRELHQVVLDSRAKDAANDVSSRMVWKCLDVG